MRPSRRDFLKLVTASGISLGVSRLALAQVPDFITRETLPGRAGWNPAARGFGRIDGVAKVTGAKIYTSDFRAADLPGWPPNTSYAMLVRAADATHVFAGMDLAFLSDAAKPSVVVTAEDLERIDLGSEEVAPFRTRLEAWLEKHGARAVLVRPDRYVFGTGEPDALLAAWGRALRPAPSLATTR